MVDLSIVEYLGEPEVLAQLAEEAAELAQAALKLRRAITGGNPTPKTEAECRAALLEEVADVELCKRSNNADCPCEIGTVSSVGGTYNV